MLNHRRVVEWYLLVGVFSMTDLMCEAVTCKGSPIFKECEVRQLLPNAKDTFFWQPHLHGKQPRFHIDPVGQDLLATVDVLVTGEPLPQSMEDCMSRQNKIEVVDKIQPGGALSCTAGNFSSHCEESDGEWKCAVGFSSDSFFSPVLRLDGSREMRVHLESASSVKISFVPVCDDDCAMSWASFNCMGESGSPVVRLHETFLCDSVPNCPYVYGEATFDESTQVCVDGNMSTPATVSTSTTTSKPPEEDFGSVGQTVGICIAFVVALSVIPAIAYRFVFQCKGFRESIFLPLTLVCCGTFAIGLLFMGIQMLGEDSLNSSTKSDVVIRDCSLGAGIALACNFSMALFLCLNPCRNWRGTAGRADSRDQDQAGVNGQSQRDVGGNGDDGTMDYTETLTRYLRNPQQLGHNNNSFLADLTDGMVGFSATARAKPALESALPPSYEEVMANMPSKESDLSDPSPGS